MNVKPKPPQIHHDLQAVPESLCINPSPCGPDESKLPNTRLDECSLPSPWETDQEHTIASHAAAQDRDDVRARFA
jgi:hypothetical protein